MVSSTSVALKRLPMLTAATLGALSPAIVASLLIRSPAILWNFSPSEPIGLYTRWSARPRLGSLIAFDAPAPARPYTDLTMRYLRRTPILKAVAAEEGDWVCTSGHNLSINGKWMAPLVLRDRLGVELPQWNACRPLFPGEYFVFSNLIPNSFDSRYYGPIHSSEILGVFRPLATLSGAKAG